MCQKALRDAKGDKKKAETEIPRNSPTKRPQKTEGDIENGQSARLTEVQRKSKPPASQRAERSGKRTG